MKTERAWTVTPHEAGEHVHVQVRCGQPGSRPLLGTLVMSPQQWAQFNAAMKPLTEDRSDG